MVAGFGLSYAKCVFEGCVLHQSAKSAAKLRQCWVCAVIRGNFALIAARSAAVPVLVLPSFEAGIKPRQDRLSPLFVMQTGRPAWVGL